MRGVRHEPLIWVSAVGVLVIWIAFLLLAGTKLTLNWEAIDKLPHALTLWVIVSLAFRRWMWRWKLFQGWLVFRPDLQGSWQGTIESKWQEAYSDKRIEPIDAILVIRQTLSSISCTLYTKESESFSSLGEVHVDEDSGIPFLKYNYTNKPRATIRERSPIHDGTASLRIITSPERRLEGEFWTSRCTAGAISLKFVSRELRESFPDPD